MRVHQVLEAQAVRSRGRAQGQVMEVLRAQGEEPGGASGRGLGVGTD